MRYLILLLAICFSLAAKAQSLNVYDLLILGTIEEINWSQYYLIANKGFKFQYYSGKDEGGWENYHFQKGEENIIVGMGSKTTETGDFFELASIQYKIKGYQSHKAFVDLMIEFGFEMIENHENKDGSSYTLWSGSLNLHDKLNIISIRKKDDFYTISL